MMDGSHVLGLCASACTQSTAYESMNTFKVKLKIVSFIFAQISGFMVHFYSTFCIFFMRVHRKKS